MLIEKYHTSGKERSERESSEEKWKTYKKNLICFQVFNAL